MNPWRRHAREVIEVVLKQHDYVDDDRLTQALRDAYPFGERKHGPYKAWLTEMKLMRRWLAFRVARDHLRGAL